MVQLLYNNGKTIQGLEMVYHLKTKEVRVVFPDVHQASSSHISFDVTDELLIHSSTLRKMHIVHHTINEPE